MATYRLAPALLFACAIGCVASGEPPHENASEPVGAPITASPLAVTPFAPLPVIPAGPVVAENLNVTIVAADPGGTARAIEALVSDAGGRVTSLSANSNNATIQVEVSPQTHGAIRHGITRLPATIAEESVSSSDYRQALTPLIDRFEKLAMSEAHLDQVMRSTNERRTFEAMLVQRELSGRERESIRQQIASILEQTRVVRMYMTVQRQASSAHAMENYGLQ